MNFKVEHIVILALSLLMVWGACSCSSSKDQSNPLIGLWSSGYQTSWEFFENGRAVNIIKGNVRPGNESISRKNTKGIYTETVYGPLNYQYKVKGDTVFFDAIGSVNKETWMRYGGVIDGNRLTLWNYKTLKGITTHIDEIGVYWKDGIKTAQDTQKVVVIIDSDHRGPLHIAFGQNQGDHIKHNSKGQPIIEIQNGSITKTRLNHDPRFMSTDAFDFKIRDCDTGEISDLNDWGHNRYRALATAMYKTDTVHFENSDFQLSAFSLGYNQYARDMLDYQFGEYIEGQIASFSIETLEDRYVYKDYIRKLEKGAVMIQKD